MGMYSLINSDDPNELIICCGECKKELKADKRLSKNLTPPPGMAWDCEAGAPTLDSLLWDRLITNHKPVCGNE